ncbi:MAG: hypothetical protein SAK29_36250 [Scytonema sp. PMC 1069.18]|nr:hypothetical protein [Scytonema sp. PMC 1069.18]MEC4886993.1 hypothetical protein [Scytonema sp. PMC 1070.18]
MNSNTQSADSTDPHSHKLADIVGTAIGLFTLVVPLFIIAHYSSSSVPIQPRPVTYHVKRHGD